jgi:hypothetical protein
MMMMRNWMLIVGFCNLQVWLICRLDELVGFCVIMRIVNLRFFWG